MSAGNVALEIGRRATLSLPGYFFARLAAFFSFAVFKGAFFVCFFAFCDLAMVVFFLGYSGLEKSGPSAAMRGNLRWSGKFKADLALDDFAQSGILG